MSLERTHIVQRDMRVTPRAHKRGQTRPAHKRGQTIVEYVLLMALLAGGVFIFKDTLLAPLLSILGGTTNAIRVEATRGGERDVQNYYAGSCSKADTRAGCQ